MAPHYPGYGKYLSLDSCDTHVSWALAEYELMLSPHDVFIGIFSRYVSIKRLSGFALSCARY